MIRSAVTISLVPEARGGPFVFWGDLAAGCRKAAAIGFNAVEIFPPSADAVRVSELRTILDGEGLKLAAVGTGAGWVKHKLRLTDPDATSRARAHDFVRSIIDSAGAFGAPAIIGSMQGRWGDDLSREDALAYLGEALTELGDHARRHGTFLIYEPLNRYETNLITTLADGAALLRSLGEPNVKLLADLFHMNIEEPNLPDALRAAGAHVGHVHLADSNRRPTGAGHTEFAPIAAALREINYAGYASAECLPWPDPDEAARRTISTFRAHFAGVRTD